MTPAERFEGALRSPEPSRAMRTLVLELAGEGNRKQEEHAKAEPLHRQALEIRKPALGEMHPAPALPAAL